MTFDVSIITPAHALLGALVFCAMNMALFFFLRSRPNNFLIPNSKHIYYAGSIMALVLGAVAIFQVASYRLAIGLCVATVCIIAFGRIDEKKNLSAFTQLVLQAVIGSSVVYAGWNIPYVSNIFHAGVLFLNNPIVWGIAPGALLAFVWIIACMNAVNFLDGTDGLAVSVVAVACIALAGISLLSATQDTQTFVLAISGFSALAGFFIWNAPPARVYLGTTGSWFIGLYIALTAMIGGGKISTTLIVLALPILDALVVMWHRMRNGIPPWRKDTSSHLHHRLALAGVSKWNIIFIVIACTFVLACIGVFASTEVKIIAFAILALLFFIASSRMMKGATL